MISESRKHYPWQDELWDWQRVEEEKRGGRPDILSWDVPHAKLSDLFRCLDTARATPEVWERVLEQANRSYVDPGIVPDDHPEVERQSEITHFVRTFTNWFRMKNKIHDNPIPYSGVMRILRAIARGETDRSNVEEIKKCFGHSFITDDTACRTNKD